MNRRTGPRRAADAEKRLAVYDGRDCVGEIEERGGGRIVAYAIEQQGRVEIGKFANRIDAMRAIGRVRR
jgi:hypothetical protein